MPEAAMLPLVYLLLSGQFGRRRPNLIGRVVTQHSPSIFQPVYSFHHLLDSKQDCHSRERAGTGTRPYGGAIAGDWDRIISYELKQRVF